jgi:hypothetical protein
LRNRSQDREHSFDWVWVLCIFTDEYACQYRTIR